MENPILHNNAHPCRFCGKPVRGRSDKLYCDVTCKNGFHNLAQREDRRDVQHIDRILKHNRKVLKSILGTRPKAKVHKAELIRRGLQFDFHTHVQMHAKRENVTCCYEYGYLSLGGEKTLVVKIKV